eukprot:CAMPEP_0173439860 /NCGR_PEP_ID=MMETSP1357-20121228/21750_1 /TAXON_ID=77926 /ORGANISM="Hemiselmis rufescens, Strain PCC563" /LENGTH=124 /DNA_ID=CAMNT_0014405271 /DNA_START=58 /DNA_END=432 /DNA_ORIENTATION=-
MPLEQQDRATRIASKALAPSVAAWNAADFPLTSTGPWGDEDLLLPPYRVSGFLLRPSSPSTAPTTASSYSFCQSLARRSSSAKAGLAVEPRGRGGPGAGCGQDQTLRGKEDAEVGLGTVGVMYW